MRFEDSFELFGGGAGHGTYGDITCEWCGTTHNEGEDEREVYDGESVSHTDFAGKQICECCFEKIEHEILCRMRDILPWYRRYLDSRRGDFDAAESALKAVEDHPDA